MRSELGSENGSVPVRTVLGLLIAALGAIFLAENLGLIEGRDLLRRFWPAAFVTLGFIMLLQPHGRGANRLWGWVPIGFGVWIFARQERWIDFDVWDLFFPGILILYGGRLVWRGVAAPRSRRPDAAEASDAYVRSFAVMAGNEVRSTARAFRGGELGAFMGGVVLDLTQAELEGDEATIEVFAMWAGIEIKVPAGWGVVGKVVPLMGAFEDKTRPASAPPTKRLVVRGFVVMGGVEVKS